MNPKVCSFLGRLERVLVRLGVALIACVAVWAVWWPSSQGLFARDEPAVLGPPLSGLPKPYEEAEALPKFEDMKKSAEDGDPSAAYILAKYYTREIPDPRDRRVWLEKAAAARYPPACYALGLMLRDEGRIPEAVKNLTIARDEGAEETDRRYSEEARRALLEIENAAVARPRDKAAPEK